VSEVELPDELLVPRVDGDIRRLVLEDGRGVLLAFTTPDEFTAAWGEGWPSAELGEPMPTEDVFTTVLDAGAVALVVDMALEVSADDIRELLGCAE